MTKSLSRAFGAMLAASIVLYACPAALAQTAEQKLYESIRGNEVEQVRSLLATNVDLTWQGELGTPLHLAALKDDVVAAELLLARGAALDARSSEKGQTPVHVASENGSPNVARLLLAKTPDLEAKDLRGRTALILAAVAGNAEIASLLIEAGAQLDARDDFERATALHNPAISGRLQVVQLLIDKGATIDILDPSGQCDVSRAR